MLDNALALLFVRGERPIMDSKFDLSRHPRIRLTTEGGAPPYEHGRDTRSVASATPAHGAEARSESPAEGAPAASEARYSLLSSEEVEALFDLARS